MIFRDRVFGLISSFLGLASWLVLKLLIALIFVAALILALLLASFIVSFYFSVPLVLGPPPGTSNILFPYAYINICSNTDPKTKNIYINIIFDFRLNEYFIYIGVAN